MLKFLKMTEAEDVTTTTVAEEEILDQEETETLLQDVKVLEEVLEATEILLLDAKVLAEDLEATETLLQEKEVSEETKEVPTELQDVQKALVIHQDQEDQEEINLFNILKYKSQIPDIIGIWDFFLYLTILAAALLIFL